MPTDTPIPPGVLTPHARYDQMIDGFLVDDPKNLAATLQDAMEARVFWWMIQKILRQHWAGFLYTEVPWIKAFNNDGPLPTIVNVMLLGVSRI